MPIPKLVLKLPVVTTRVLLAEDHTIVRQGLRSLIDAQPDMEVVAEAENGREALSLVEEHKPDIALLDVTMPQLNGIDATAQISRMEGTQVIVLSMHSSEDFVRAAVRAGARGYLVKGAGLSDLVQAIRAVASGDAFFSPVVAKFLLSDSPEGASKLSPREREVLQLVGEGYSTAAAAKLLSLSAKTIEGHRARIMQKLGVSNVAGMVRHAVRMGLVDVEED